LSWDFPLGGHDPVTPPTAELPSSDRAWLAAGLAASEALARGWNVERT
jgi:hypothetical protein